VFLGGMGYMTIDGYINGNVGLMLAPIMTGEIICGQPGIALDYPVLYVPDLSSAVNPSITNFFVNSTCATECPDNDSTTMVCVDQTLCDAYPSYDTTEVIDYCIPSASALANVYSNGDGSFNSSNYFISMYESRWVILTCIGISLVIALIYLKLMDWFAVQIAWVTIVVIEICLIVMGYFTYTYSQGIKDTHGDRTNQSDTLFWSAIGMWILAALYYLVLACNFRSLRISIAVIETAADFFTDTKRIVLVPLIYFVIWCGIFVFWLWGLAGIASITSD